jgi:uncharacterized protein with von Willebrand factor type A (vWA) domain
VNRDDLLKLLDLQGKEVSKETSTVSITPQDQQPVPASLSPTALDLDEWGLRRGQEVLAESPRLQQTGLDDLAVADFHGVAFEPEPVLLDACQDAQRWEFLAQLLQTPDYHALHCGTQLDPLASSIAATAFAEQFAQLKKEEESRSETNTPTEGGKEDLDRDMAVLRAVGRAISEASKEVEECKEACAALGLGPGAPGSNDPRAIADLFRRVRNNPVLRRICELAGRYRRLAQSRQRQKTIHGMDDVVGVTMDGDVGRLLPSELARLAGDDELADDTLRRLVERQCLSREYGGIEPVGKGPIAIVVDESGSMSGTKVETAKALALALAWVARFQNRWCALVAYSGSSGERLLALPPGRWDEAALLSWLEEFIGRGSDLDLPLRELPAYFRRLRCPEGVTDIVVITDAILRIPDSLRASFNAWKVQVKARMISLVVRSEPGDLSSVSDEVHLVSGLDPSTEAVGRVLSI